MDIKKSVRSCWSQNITLKAFCLFKQFEPIAFFLFISVQRVFIRGSYSSEGTVKYDVPQGSVMEPVFFFIYINALPLHIPSNSAECHMLADDTTLHTTGKSIVKIKEMLQLCFVRISVWCNTNHMLINPVKNKVNGMVITTRQKHQLPHLSLRMVRILKM